MYSGRFSAFNRGGDNPVMQLRVIDKVQPGAKTGGLWSEPVQFNIRKPATAGSIVVDDANHGIVEFSLAGDWYILGVGCCILPNGSHADKPGKPPSAIEAQIYVKASVDPHGRYARWEVRLGGPPYSGNVTLRFDVGITTMVPAVEGMPGELRDLDLRHCRE